ncbi:MAG: SRPBCC family protein [Brevundimonas sp.]|jgi:uncharacterized protein YndB with AHSA1/START domain|uniref:SRPBCC family protein n=1 Tax=Brevundimonas sp. TaxID=1871086 RepID=UPI0022C6704F|nr:SRPBCC domain-containing protein [Brevundimonas sp.]MCZ8194168.1 SRPBCC domain-containing protein [Brevundimonas sp.]
MRAIRLSRTYNYPRDMVWAAIADSDALADWLMPNDFQPVLGHAFTFRTKPAPGFDGIVHAKVLDIVPPERLVLAWKGGPLDTTVTFDLVEVTETETRLTLIHDGFRGSSNLMPRVFLGMGWKNLLSRKLADCIARRRAR